MISVYVPFHWNGTLLQLHIVVMMNVNILLLYFLSEPRENCLLSILKLWDDYLDAVMFGLRTKTQMSTKNSLHNFRFTFHKSQNTTWLVYGLPTDSYQSVCLSTYQSIVVCLPACLSICM